MMMSLTNNNFPAETLLSAPSLAPHWAQYPNSYVAGKIPNNFPRLSEEINGDLTKPVWSSAPWSDLFDDIQGPKDAPSSSRPPASCPTRMKMLWDDEYLYIGAELTTDFETVATFKHRNDPIFQQDSDFEVFVNPLGSCHYYKEFEVNALNTVWNLMINKPYSNGGSEHSGRIAKPDEPGYYDVLHQKSATKLIKGKLNQEGKGTTWTVEIAMAHSDVLAFTAVPLFPQVGDFWRINFSHCEKKGTINWTWQPQITWDPKNHRFSGFVNMHLPDAWGYVVFGEEKFHGEVTNALPDVRDPSWPLRLGAMNVYYALVSYFSEHNRYTLNMDDLVVDQDIVGPFDIQILSNNIEKEFTIRAKFEPARMLVTVTQERLVTVSEISSEMADA